MPKSNKSLYWQAQSVSREGSAKPTIKDRKRFYAISLGSLRETQAILDLIDHKNLIKEADVLGGFLYQLWKNT